MRSMEFHSGALWELLFARWSERSMARQTVCVHMNCWRMMGSAKLDIDRNSSANWFFWLTHWFLLMFDLKLAELTLWTINSRSDGKKTKFCVSEGSWPSRISFDYLIGRSRINGESIVRGAGGVAKPNRKIGVKRASSCWARLDLSNTNRGIEIEGSKSTSGAKNSISSFWLLSATCRPPAIATFHRIKEKKTAPKVKCR